MKIIVKRVLFFILVLSNAFAITINMQNNAFLNGEKSTQAQFGFGYTRGVWHYYFPRAEVTFSVLKNGAQTITPIQTISVEPPDATQFFLTFMYFNIYDANKHYLGVARCPVPIGYINYNITYIISSSPYAPHSLKCGFKVASY